MVNPRSTSTRTDLQLQRQLEDFRTHLPGRVKLPDSLLQAASRVAFCCRVPACGDMAVTSSLTRSPTGCRLRARYLGCAPVPRGRSGQVRR
jgi:hypothetical protein